MKQFLYFILDLIILKRGISRHISGFSMKIPTRFHRYFEQDYELNNINFINNYVQNKAVIIDVGAHIGLLSVILAKRAGNGGKVYSFEPTPSTFQILKETIKINHLDAVIVPVNAAVSNTEGKATFYVTNFVAHNSNSLSNNLRNYGNERGIEVDVTSIDSFTHQNKTGKIDVIKIDVEGAEYSTLKGASRVIDESRPFIILALHPDSIVNFGDTLSDIWDYVKSKNYHVFHLSKEIDKGYFISQKNLFDVFLLPIE
jgi:FkbM family methyltransferase